MTTQTFTGTITIVECANCHLPFGVTAAFDKARRDDHGTFYCPSKHQNYYPQKSDEEKLRDQLAREKRLRDSTEAQLTHTRDQLQATEYQRRAQKGANTKLRKRIAAGVCPCCNRTFQDLARHMNGQHPDYLIEGTREAIRGAE